MESVAQLERLIQGYVDRRALLGVSLAVLDRDEVAFARGFGLADAEEWRPVTPGTLFGLGSLAKTVLATLILCLVEQGRLDLNVPVVDYLPGFVFSDSAPGRQVTLRHLLSHTSGLPSAGKDWGPPERDALARFAREQISRYGFVAEPGRVHLYSNTAITLAGYVAEVVTGRPYRELVRDLVCLRLGMDRTTYEHAVAMTYPLALPHDLVDGEFRDHHRWADNPSGDPSSFLIGSAVDLAQLGIALLNDGRYRGRQFLSLESVAQMQAPVATIPKLGATHPFAHLHAGYGLGLRIGTYRGERVVHHGGMSQSFNNSFVLLPDRRRGFVVLTNGSEDGAVVELVLHLCNYLLDRPDAGIVLLDPPPSLPDGGDRARWRDHVGEYLNVGNGRLVAVAIDGDSLTLREGDATWPLGAVAERSYWYEDPAEGRLLVSFLPEDDNPTEYLYLAGEPYRRVVRDPAYAPDRAAWGDFVGTYRDPSNLDPDGIIAIRYRDDHLYLLGEGEEEECVPFGQDTFLSSWGLLEFARDGAKTAPTLIVGRATRYRRVG